MQFRDKVELIFQIFEARIRRPFDDKKIVCLAFQLA